MANLALYTSRYKRYKKYFRIGQGEGVVVLSRMLFLYSTPNFLCIKWYHNDQVIRHRTYSFSLYFPSVKKFRKSSIDKKFLREFNFANWQ